MKQQGRDSRSAILAQFAVRSFRFRFPADLLTFWASEMEGHNPRPGIVGGRISLSLCMVPMAVMLLHGAGAKFRGRVMRMRMLAIDGLPMGLLAAGWLIQPFGFATTVSGYCVVGLVPTAIIALRWRQALWPLDAAPTPPDLADRRFCLRGSLERAQRRLVGGGRRRLT